jgi:hypothetical protein
MARQRGRLQLEESDMRLTMNMGKMANGLCSRATIEKTEHLVQTPHAAVREEKKRGVEFSAHQMVKAAIERHSARLLQNHTPGYLPLPK